VAEASHSAFLLVLAADSAAAGIVPITISLGARSEGPGRAVMDESIPGGLPSSDRL
jgi:hypothetical protein